MNNINWQFIAKYAHVISMDASYVHLMYQLNSMHAKQNHVTVSYC